jgi:hypothetical protein
MFLDGIRTVVFISFPLRALRLCVNRVVFFQRVPLHQKESSPGFFDSFLPAGKRRIAVVLNFRRPSTPCGYRL